MERRKRLAIISSYNESCGNASYTEVLRREFSNYCDVEILPLPQFLLKSKFAQVIKKADKYIDELAERVKEFDYVNIQFEAGLFGNTRTEIYRRVSKLIGASNNLIVTMHRVDMPRSVMDRSILKLLVRFKFFEALQVMRNNRFFSIYRDIVRLIKEKNRSGNAAVIVHTKRDRINIQEVFGFDNVYDFPITFLNKAQRTRTRNEAYRSEFLQKYGFSENDVVIGLFGFISSYKGFDTVLHALQYLPSNYKVAFWGRQHPMSILENVPLDEYIGRLLKNIEDHSIDIQTILSILASGITRNSSLWVCFP